MGFSQPASAGGDNFDAKEHVEHLLLVYPKHFEPAVMTKASKDPTAQADVDIIIVDKLAPDGKPMSFVNARLFGNLAKSVRNDIGGQVLGRLAQGEPSPGRTAPWILRNFTDQDVMMATPVDVAYRQGMFKVTENPMAPAAAPAAVSYQSAPPAPAPTWQPPAQQWTPAATPPAPYAAPATAPAQPPWAAAATPSPATAPAAPAAAQWTPPTAAPAPAPPAPQAAIDPNLLAFLASKGVPGPFPDQATAEAVAASFQ